MNRKKNIVLAGFMGCGKTTVGLRLSYRLRRPVEDSDKIIERKEGCAISGIFARKGEDYFRELETRTLEELAEKAHGKIISVGGGTPVKEENRRLMKALGTVVWLRVRPETVFERLRGDKTRPLLQGEDPQGKIRELMERREAAYRAAADIIVDVDGLDMEDILHHIELQLKRKAHPRHRRAGRRKRKGKI